MEILSLPLAKEERAMTISYTNEKVWWKEPLERTELIWVVIALIWCLIMFFMMPYWHIYGQQNLSNEAYRAKPEDFAKKTEEMIAKYKVREEGPDNLKVPVVRPPAGSDVYLIARLELDADPRARGGQVLPHPPHVDGLAARLLAAAREHQHPGARATTTCSRSRRPTRAPRSSATSIAA